MQIQILSDMNWKLILALILLSGILAYLGDVVGMKIGKRRVSLLGLRPKTTSRFITAFTGMLIALAMLVTMSVISDDVRTALFSMKFIQSQLKTLTRDLQESRDKSQLTSLTLMDTEKRLEEQQKSLQSTRSELEKMLPELESAEQRLAQVQREKELLEKEKETLTTAIVDLKSESETLRQGLIEMRSGRFAVFANEVLAQAAVEPMSDGSDVERIFQNLRDQIKRVLAARTGKNLSEIVLDVDPESEKQTISECTKHPDRKSVRAKAAGNILYDEDVRITYEVNDSILVYRKGEVLYQTILNGTGDASLDAEAELHLILRMVNRKATADSIRPDPATGKVGVVDATEFFEAADTVRNADYPVQIEISAAEDIYTEGPVRVGITVEKAL